MWGITVTLLNGENHSDTAECGESQWHCWMEGITVTLLNGGHHSDTAECGESQWHCVSLWCVQQFGTVYKLNVFSKAACYGKNHFTGN